jgi:hypothetical protein
MSTVVRHERYQRGVFGKIFKFCFVAFNLLMVVWLISYWVQIGSMYNGITSEAGRAGASIGATVGTSMLLFLWLCGDVILGLLTFFSRGEKIITEEIQE